MDPHATLKVVNDESLELSTRAQAAIDLLVWLAKGGIVPAYGYMVDSCHGVLAKVLDHMEGEDERIAQRVDDAVYEHEAGDDL